MSAPRTRDEDTERTEEKARTFSGGEGAEGRRRSSSNVYFKRAVVLAVDASENAKLAFECKLILFIFFILLSYYFFYTIRYLT